MTSLDHIEVCYYPLINAISFNDINGCNNYLSDNLAICIPVEILLYTLTLGRLPILKLIVSTNQSYYINEYSFDLLKTVINLNDHDAWKLLIELGCNVSTARDSDSLLHYITPNTHKYIISDVTTHNQIDISFVASLSEHDQLLNQFHPSTITFRGPADFYSALQKAITSQSLGIVQWLLTNKVSDTHIHSPTMELRHLCTTTLGIIADYYHDNDYHYVPGSVVDAITHCLNCGGAVVDREEYYALLKSLLLSRNAFDAIKMMLNQRVLRLHGDHLRQIGHPLEWRSHYRSETEYLPLLLDSGAVLPKHFRLDGDCLFPFAFIKRLIYIEGYTLTFNDIYYYLMSSQFECFHEMVCDPSCAALWSTIREWVQSSPPSTLMDGTVDDDHIMPDFGHFIASILAANQYDTIDHLTKLGFNFPQDCGEWFFPLHFDLPPKAIDFVLTKWKYPIDRATPAGETALLTAASMDDTMPMAVALFERNATLGDFTNIQFFDPTTLLLNAIQFGNIPFIQFILDSGIGLPPRDDHYSEVIFPTIVLPRENSVGIIDLLLQYGCDKDAIVDSVSYRSIDDIAVMRRLVQLGADPNGIHPRSLPDATHSPQSCTASLEYLHDVDCTQTGTYPVIHGRGKGNHNPCWTILHHAILSGDWEFVEGLIELGAVIDFTPPSKTYTPVMIPMVITTFRDPENVRFMIDHCDGYALSHPTARYLMLKTACQLNEHDIIQLLMGYDVVPSHPDLLVILLSHGNWRILRQLDRTVVVEWLHGVLPHRIADAINTYGSAATAFLREYSFPFHKQDVIQSLVKHTYDPSTADSALNAIIDCIQPSLDPVPAWSPCDAGVVALIKKGKWDTAFRLIEAKANVHCCSEGTYTLEVAIKYSPYTYTTADHVSRLLGLGVSVDAPPPNTSTKMLSYNPPVLTALQLLRWDVFRCLIRHGANVMVTTKDEDSFSILHIIAREGCIQAYPRKQPISVLIEAIRLVKGSPTYHSGLLSMEDAHSKRPVDYIPSPSHPLYPHLSA